MSEEVTYFSAFIIGVLSAVHCVGMCGGIVSAMSLGMDRTVSRARRIQIQFAYNLGRIGSYTLAGLIVGGLSSILTQQFSSHSLHQILQTVSAVVLILMGLYLANWWRILAKIEQAGTVLWKRIEPITRPLIPIKNIQHGFLVGLVWGWLPCGLVYSMLILSLNTGSAKQGSLLMLSFGLGTLPNLLAFGLLAGSLQAVLNNPAVRKLAGIMVIGLAIYLLADSWWPMSEGHVHQHSH